MPMAKVSAKIFSHPFMVSFRAEFRLSSKEYLSSDGRIENSTSACGEAEKEGNAVEEVGEVLTRIEMRAAVLYTAGKEYRRLGMNRFGRSGKHVRPPVI